MLFSQRLGLDLHFPQKRIVVFDVKSIKCDVTSRLLSISTCYSRRPGSLRAVLSAGTALASLPWQRVCRRSSQRTVLVDLPQITPGSSDTCCSRRTRNATTAFASHEENWFVFARSHRPPLTRTGKAIDGKFFITSSSSRIVLLATAIPAARIHAPS